MCYVQRFGIFAPNLCTGPLKPTSSKTWQSQFPPPLNSIRPSHRWTEPGNPKRRVRRYSTSSTGNGNPASQRAAFHPLSAS